MSETSPAGRDGLWNALGLPAFTGVVVINTIPLFGALILGWQIGFVLFYIWLEFAVAGLVNLLKMWRAGSTSSTNRDDDSRSLAQKGFDVFRQIRTTAVYIALYAGASLFFFVFVITIVAGEQQDAREFGEVELPEGIVESLVWTPEVGVIALVILVHEIMKFSRDDAYLERTVDEQSKTRLKPALICAFLMVAAGVAWAHIAHPLPVIFAIILLKMGVEIHEVRTGYDS